MRPESRAGLAVLALLLGACASAPESRRAGLASTEPLETVTRERHLIVAQHIDTARLAEAPRFSLPRARIAEGAADPGITPAQAVLVANNAARSLCDALGNYAELVPAPEPGTLDPELVVTAIVATSAGASGASSVLGVFVPGPFRLPAGLGALAVDAELRDAEGRQVALMRWARGANAITDDAKVSAIGDAWQLADSFGEEFTRALLDRDTEKAGMQRDRLDRERARANDALCDARYGVVNLAGRGASLLLPLAPEAIDPGPPAEAPLPAAPAATGGETVSGGR